MNTDNKTVGMAVALAGQTEPCERPLDQNTETDVTEAAEAAEAVKYSNYMMGHHHEYAALMASSRAGRAFPYLKAKKRRVIRKRDHVKVAKIDRRNRLKFR